MPIAIDQARDEIYAVFLQSWLADPASQNIQVVYPDFGDDLPTNSLNPQIATIPAFVSVTISHKSSKRVSIGANALWRTEGELIALIHTPARRGRVMNDALVKIVQAAYRTAKSFNIRYRDVTASELGRSGIWAVSRVSVDFDYNEVG